MRFSVIRRTTIKNFTMAPVNAQPSSPCSGRGPAIWESVGSAPEAMVQNIWDSLERMVRAAVLQLPAPHNKTVEKRDMTFFEQP